MKNSGQKVGVLDAGYSSYGHEKKILESNGYTLEVFPDHFGGRDEKIAFSRDKTGLFIRQTEIDSAFLGECPHLKAIVRYGIGYDNINLEEAKKFKVKVANVQGYATRCVAEHAMGLMFACLRALPAGIRDITNRFGKPPIEDIFELNDKTLGIIGLGRIGGKFALNCRPLFKKILAADPYVPESRFGETGATRAGLEEIFNESRIISIHCNLTSETFHIINRESFGLMKKRPVIINTARGPVMNEADLLWALNENLVHSAGIDVWEEEPASEKQQQLIEHPRVVPTGHYAWYSDRSSIELQKRAAENMVGLLKGDPVGDILV